MKILFVTMQFGHGYAQGTERYLATLGACLRERGHEVSYLAGDPLGSGGRRRLGELIDAEQRHYAYPTRGWMAVTGLPAGRLGRWLQQHRPGRLHARNPRP